MRKPRIAGDEQFDRIVAARLHRIGIDLRKARQTHLVVLRFVAAQPRADHDHQIGLAVNLLGLARHVERAQAVGMTFRHHGAAIGRGDDADAALGKRGRRRGRAARAAAEPQHGTLGLQHHGGKRVEARCARRSQWNGRHARYVPLQDLGALNVDWDFERYWTGRRCERRRRGLEQRIDGSDRLPNADVVLADRLEHVGLPRHIVDRGAIAVDEFAVDLRGDVQDRRTGRERFNLRAGRVAGRGPGAGDDDAERTRDAGKRVRHVHGAGLAARGHEANPALTCDGVEDRHIVDRDYAERRRHADIGERSRDRVADRLVAAGGVAIYAGTDRKHLVAW